MILIVNKRDETPKSQPTPGSIDEPSKASTAAISPRLIRQRERSGVETDDDELLGQIQTILDHNAGVGEEDLLKEKIIEARLIAQREFPLATVHSIDFLPSSSLTVKTIYKSFMNEKENLTKLEQQMNEKPTDQSNAALQPPAATSDVEPTSNQTVDILQELLNTIKQNNQLEVRENVMTGRSVCTLILLLCRRRSKPSNATSRTRTNVSKICAWNCVSVA